MELALLTFEKIIAMFIILIIGILCYKLKFISIEGNKSLSSVLLFVVNPVIMLMYGREAQSKTRIASPATIPKSGERNRKIHSCMLYLISI